MTREQEIQKLKENSPFALPDNPSGSGWPAKQIKQKFYEGFFVLYEFLCNDRDALQHFKDTEIADIKQALLDFTSGSRTAGKARLDVDGNEIKTTYAKVEAIVSGMIASLKYVKEDGITTENIYQIEKDLEAFKQTYNKFLSDNFVDGKAKFAIETGAVESALRDDLGRIIKTTYATVTSVTTLQSEVTKILNGTNAVDKARKDQDGNLINQTYVKKAQIVNDLNSESTDAPLSAKQGKVLKGLITAIQTLLASDDTSLDQLQEVVTYIKANRSLIASITTDKVSVEDIVDSLDSNAANQPLSAKQGKALKGLIDALSEALDEAIEDLEEEDKKAIKSLWGLEPDEDGNLNPNSFIPVGSYDAATGKMTVTNPLTAQQIAQYKIGLDAADKTAMKNEIYAQVMATKGRVFTRRFTGNSMTGDLYIDGVERTDIVNQIGTDVSGAVRNDFDFAPFFGEFQKVRLAAKNASGQPVLDGNGNQVYDDVVFIPNYWFRFTEGTDLLGNKFVEYSIATTEQYGFTRMKVRADGTIPSHIGIGAYMVTDDSTLTDGLKCGCTKGKDVGVSRTVAGFRGQYRYVQDIAHGITTLTRLHNADFTDIDLVIHAATIEFGNRNLPALFDHYLSGTYHGWSYMSADEKAWNNNGTDVGNTLIIAIAKWNTWHTNGVDVGGTLGMYSYTAADFDRPSSTTWKQCKIMSAEDYEVDDVVVGKKLTFDVTFMPNRIAFMGEHPGDAVGSTDAIVASSGKMTNWPAGKRYHKYRGIENPFSNGFQTLTDGYALKVTYGEGSVRERFDLIKVDPTASSVTDTSDNWTIDIPNILTFALGTSANVTGYVGKMEWHDGKLIPASKDAGGSTYWNCYFGIYNTSQKYYNIVRGGRWYYGANFWSLHWHVELVWSYSAYHYSVRPVLY